jgi:hypothetical protein
VQRRRQPRFRCASGLALATLLAWAVAPDVARAQVAFDCAQASSTVDFDADGLFDRQECDGLPLPSGVRFPSCVGSTLPRSACLDPRSRDLFVMLVRAAAGSNLPNDPFVFVKRPQEQGGLGIETHLIPPTDDRQVTATQKAVRITESLDANGEILGVAQYGTPNGLDLATVFTERIKNFVNGQCAGATSCTSSTGASGPAAIVELYIQHTFAHELGHMLQLALEYNRRFGGYHYKSGSEVVMEQSVVVSSKGGRVTFLISTQYADSDKMEATLR